MSNPGGIDTIIPGTEDNIKKADQEGKEQEQTYKAPTFFSQLKKELADSEDAKKYAGNYKDINELVSEHIASKKSLETALIFPGENATADEIKAFFGKLGVPADKTGYKLSNYDIKEEQLQTIKDSFIEAAHKGALSNKQAQHMWQHLIATVKAGASSIEASHQKVKDNFTPAYHKMLEAEYPVEEERTKAIKGEISLAKAFMLRTGLTEKMEKSGLLYDPAIIHALASEEKSHSASFVEGNKGGQEKPKTGGIEYGDQFMTAIGAK